MARDRQSCVQYLHERLVSSSVADFAKLERETLLDLVLVNTSPLYVGSGKDLDVLGSPVDLSVIRGRVAEVRDGRVLVYEGPIIPGSSLKGVTRSIAESIAAGKGWLSPSVTVANKEVSCTAESLTDLEKLLRSESCNKEVIDEYFETCFASPVVKLFGAPWLASHIYFYDAYPVDMTPPRTKVVTRVAIDRITGSQRPGQLYTMEFIEAGTRWRARIRLTNIDLRSGSKEAILVRELLLLLAKAGIPVGGRTSVGHGVLQLIAKESRIIETRIDPAKGIVTTIFPITEILPLKSIEGGS